MEKPEDRDLKEADLTWEGKHYYRGVNEGDTNRLRQSIKDLSAFLPSELTLERQSRLATMTRSELSVLWQHLITHRVWPQDR